MGWTSKGPLGGDRKLPLAGTVAVINVNSSSVYLGVLSVIFLGDTCATKEEDGNEIDLGRLVKDKVICLEYSVAVWVWCVRPSAVRPANLKVPTTARPRYLY